LCFSFFLTFLHLTFHCHFLPAGVIPMLGAPMAGASEALLQQAMHSAAARGLVGPNDHVVCSNQRSKQQTSRGDYLA